MSTAIFSKLAPPVDPFSMNKAAMNTSQVFNKAEITFWLVAMKVIMLLGNCLPGHRASIHQVRNNRLFLDIGFALAGFLLGVSIGVLIRIWLVQ